VGSAGTRKPKQRTAEAKNDAALRANAAPVPPVAMKTPAKGARAICDITAVDHSAEFAPSTSLALTSEGSTLAAAGLKNTEKLDKANAAAYTITRSWWRRAKSTATTT